MDLFIESSLSFEKAAAEVSLPEDPNSWPNEIMQELFKQVPYIADFEPHVVMDRVDAERGFAFGHVEITNKTEMHSGAAPHEQEAAGVKTARIPVIVKDRRLQPFDVIVTADSKMLPLTEGRLRQAIFRPQGFDITGRTPGDVGIGSQLYPPSRHGGGMGGMGGMEGGKMAAAPAGMLGHALAGARSWASPREALKMAPNVMTVAKGLTSSKGRDALRASGSRVRDLGATVAGYGAVPAAAAGAAGAGAYALARKNGGEKTASVLEAILPTINESDYNGLFDQLRDDRLQAAFMKNAHATGSSLKLLADYEPSSLRKNASALIDSIKPTVVQLVREQDGYTVKSASHRFWAVREQQMDRRQALQTFGEKIVLAADLSGSTTMATGAAASEPAEGPEADRPELVSQFGLYKVQDEKGRELVGFVFPNLMDVDGVALPLALFTNGSQAAVQGEIVGVRAGEGASLFEGSPTGRGCFYETLPNGKAQATIPLTIRGQLSGGEETDGVVFMAETFDGREVQVMIQPGIQTVVEGDENHMLVPSHMRWLPLDNAETVELASSPDTFGKVANATQPLVSVVVRAGGVDSFSIDGMPVMKLAHDQRSFLSLDDAMFLLGGLGVDPTYGTQKLAEALDGARPITVKVGRALRLASEAHEESRKQASVALRNFPSLKVSLLKEAAVIPDPVAVDTVLSLGFINPENIATFIAYLPAIDAAQSKMCELLLAARLGLREVPSSALEKAIRATEEVIEGLKVTAFQSS